jgi:predicted site-specific integrase-resolvase
MKRHVGVSYISKMLDIKPQTLYAWAERGRIPGATKLNGLLRFNVEEVEAWIESKRIRETPTIAFPRIKSDNVDSLVENVKRSVLNSPQGKARDASKKGGE